MGDFDIKLTHEGFEALIKAIKREADHKELRRDLGKEMRRALKPAADNAKAAIKSMDSKGQTEGPALRPAIAKRIRVQVKTSGRWSGARLRSKKTPHVRGFRNAPKRTQSVKGWRVPNWGRDRSWRVQFGKIQWFDRAHQGREAEYKRAAIEAMERVAARIANR